MRQERIDAKEIEQQCESNMEKLLGSIGVEFAFENGWYMIDCPFHVSSGGKNLRYRNLSWFCFSECRKSFSSVDVVMQIMDMDFREAVRYICDVIDYDIEKVAISKSKLEAKNKIKKLGSMKITTKKVVYQQVDQFIINDVETWFPQVLLDEFKKETLVHFGVGFSRYGVLRNRIIFPVDAPDGTIISLSGRLVSTQNTELPKYKIVEGTKKSYTLFNISRINKDDDYIVVVEGFKSVMSLYENGIVSVVATMGSSLSVEQRMILLGLGKKIIVIGDNDNGGKQLLQSVYNQCYLFANVVQIQLSNYTNTEKASPTASDLGYDAMEKLIKDIKGA